MTLHRLAAQLAVYVLLGITIAAAQMPSGPPAVGVVRAEKQAVTETSEFIGRVQAVDRVVITARVTAFLEQRLFVEGTEVRQGDLLYRLERPPFEAAVAQQEAAVADASARLANANIQLARAQSLLNTPAGQRSAVDDATATQRSQAAQVMAAQAQLRMAQLNLGYTEIHAPIGGKISRTAVTAGNVVSPGSGPLVSIVSQDPMYVQFPIAVRAELDLEKRYAEQDGMNAMVIRLRLPDGTMYDQTGKIDYVEPSVQATTDTILVRGKIANPPLKPIEEGKPVDRRLVDGEFVTVLVEGIEPVDGACHPSCGRAVRSAGRLCLRGGRPEPCGAAPSETGPVHADDRGGHVRAQRRRHGGGGRASARAAGNTGGAGSRHAGAHGSQGAGTIAA